ncbi:hypothetical protein [Tenacibaculum amylolyticum]
MLNKISSLGKALDKAEQKVVSGGKVPICPPPLKEVYNPVTREWSCEYV